MLWLAALVLLSPGVLLLVAVLCACVVSSWCEHRETAEGAALD